MITKKNINIVLILLVLIIWGSIGYSYFIKKEITQKPVVAQKNIEPTQYAIRKDTFELKDIKNPFKSVFITPKTVQKTTAKKTQNKKKQLPIKIKWPSIQYHGYVLSKGSSKKLGVINVDGKIMKKREKDVVLKKINIKKIYEDSIQFEYNNIVKMIKKQ